MNKRLIYVLCIIVGICIDRITKVLAITYCFAQSCKIFPGCTFDVSFNKGIAFGFLHFNHGWATAVTSSIIPLVIGYLAWYTYIRMVSGHAIWGEVLILAGSFSNFIDRLVYHGVIDFIILSYGSYSWYSFNIADAYIVIGVSIMLYNHIRE